MQTIPDLGIPDVKPAIELYRGQQRAKVSPQYTHARLQLRCAQILDRWAIGRGRVGTEWRFYFIDGPAAPSSLIPDVAYVSFARIAENARSEAERPTIAPDIAIEILSPDDRPKHVREKVDVYLEYGTEHVILVDPETASLRYFSADAPGERVIRSGETIVIERDLIFDPEFIFAPIGL